MAALVFTVALGASAAVAQNAVITGTDRPDLIDGTSQGETIYGRQGNDIINAGDGDDTLYGGPGADILNGGPGADAVSYGGTAPVTVTIDGAANDGAAGEGDDVGPDVEDIYGGDGPDHLTGDKGANTIDGGDGSDVIDGLEGSDVVFGGDGDDAIAAADGTRDVIDCGVGDDTVTVDRLDATTNCEHVQGSAPTVSVGRFLPTFLTAVHRNSSGPLGRLSGLSGLNELSVGSVVDLSCVRACSLHRSFAVRTRLRKSTRLQLSTPVTLSQRTIVQVRVRRPGHVARYQQFTFTKLGGILVAHRIRSGCAAGAPPYGVVACP